MYKKLALTLLLSAITATAHGQASVFFQNGVTILPDESIYQGTIDTEFRAANPTEPQGGNEEISIDQFDGGFQTQGAIRFENLLISQGGLVPDDLTADDILFAEMRLWISSPTAPDGVVDFSRVVGPDTTSGDFWQNDDTWASLGGDLIPNDAGLLDCATEGLPDNCPIRRDDIEAASIPDFIVHNPGMDSADVMSEGIAAGLPLAEAIDQAFWRFDATAAVRDWLFGGAPNYGWAITNDNGDGWDFLASELVTEDESEWSEAGLTPEHFRPSLTIVYIDGPILDLDGDGDVDEDDFAAFLNLLAVEIDGPIPTGSPGDFDFNRRVDLNDFKFFKENYAAQHAMFPPLGAGASSSLAAATIPEPASVLLAVLALLGVAGMRRRHRN